MKSRHFAAAAAALVASGLAFAASVDTLKIDREDGRYWLEAGAYLAATPESIYAVLVDYDDNRYGRISSAYKESRYLEPAADGTPIVYTRLEGCMLFCLSVRRTERLETEKPYWIKSYALPEQSNVKHGTSEWWLTPDGKGGTQMKFRIEMEPAFWVPPLIGPAYLKRSLAKGGERAVARIEKLARELEGLPTEYVPPPGSSSRSR